MSGTIGSTYVQNPPYFEGMTKEPEAAHRHHRRPHPRPLRRLDHDRPHLARRHHQGDLAGRQVPAEHQVAAGRLQPVRHAPRQPRGDDARHLRQHPHQEPDGARRQRQPSRAATPSTSRTGSRCRSTTPPCSTRRRACRWSSSPARNTAPARRATGPPRARSCSASGPSIAQSFERIHRSNLVGMGVMPLVFDGETSGRRSASRATRRSRCAASPAS